MECCYEDSLITIMEDINFYKIFIKTDVWTFKENI